MIDEEERRIDKLLIDAAAAARNYTGSTGMDSYVIDLDGAPVGQEDDRACRCTFCRRFNEITGTAVPCRRVQRYGAYQADIYGGKYIYFCPTSLLHWTVPLIYKGLLMGAIVAGPALLLDPEDILQNDLLGKYRLNKGEKVKLQRELGRLPRLTTERATQLSELLALVGQGLALPLDRQQRIYRQKARQQSRIGTYIQQLKKETESLSPTAYPLEKEGQLLRSIQGGNKEESQGLLNEILGHIYFTEGQNFEKIRNCGIELTVLLSRAALKGGAGNDQVWAIKHRYVKQIEETRTSLELTFLLDQLLRQFMDQLFNLKEVKHADAIFRSLRYIQENYPRPLTLGELASHAYLSEAYFSTVFKEEVGCSFKTYLNKVRVEQSKILLKNRNLVVGDIARLCGFEEQSYYTRVFKKITGMPPGAYRERGLEE